MKRKINTEVLIQFCIFIGIAILILAALLTGRIREYVHPRMDGYLWFAAAAFPVIGIFMLAGLFKPHRGLRFLPYVLLIIPMATAYAMPAVTVENSTVNLQNVRLSFEKPESQKTGLQIYVPDDANDTIQKDDSKINEQSSIEAGQSASPSVSLQDDTALQQSAYEEDVIQADESGIITVSDDSFIQWFNEMYDDPDKYEGKTIKVKGQVFRREDFAENEFVPVRLNMVCCAADVEPIGFLCRYDDAKEWADNTWVYVTATVHTEEYKGEKMPVLYAANVTEAEKPADEYVYFPF